MAEIKVPIPADLIDAASQGEVKKLTAKVSRLEKKIKELEKNEQKAKVVLASLKELKLFLADHFDVYDYDPWD